MIADSLSRLFRSAGCCSAFFLLAITVHASTVLVGALSYDTFVPAGGGSPGIDALDLANLTGAYSLPPDFPVTDALTFQDAILTVTLSNLTQQVFDLGNIAPGFLVDIGGNPIVQVPGNEILDSAEFTAILSPLTFALSGGTIFTANSTVIDVLLLPSTGSTLTVDVDQATIGVSAATVQVTPEPSSFVLVLAVLPWLAWNWRRRRIVAARIWRQK